MDGSRDKTPGTGEIRRGTFPLDLVKMLAEEVLEKVRWDGTEGFLFLSYSTPEFESFGTTAVDSQSRHSTDEKPVTLLKTSRKTQYLACDHSSALIVAAMGGRRCAMLIANPVDYESSSSNGGNYALFETIFANDPAAIESIVRSLADKVVNPDHRKKLLSSISVAIPRKTHFLSWNVLGLDVVGCDDQRWVTSLNERAWTHLRFKLEEELGDLLEPEKIMQAFSNLIKSRLAYDYLEISILSDSFDLEIDPSNWVRNDTGLGGKLLSIILIDSFLRGLPRRRQAKIVDIERDDSIIENPELLRVMELYRGMLVPLMQGKRTHGVMKLFFRRMTDFDAKTREWLQITGAILLRALHRAWRYQAAQKMATIDGLTGLYNHRYFMEQLRKEFTRARRYRNWLSLILIDIDNFKQYNDTNGHLAGDRVLARVARTIRKSVREMDLVARWGGEEFALLLPEINVQNGMIVAEKIRREVENQRFKNEKMQPTGNLTISLGVAENSSNLKNYREMFNRADEALYHAKHSGRNRCASAK